MAVGLARSRRCPSAGRVTARLLLSFLAVSGSHATAVDGGAVIPLPNGPMLAPLDPEPPAPAEHTFVSLPAVPDAALLC